MTIKAKERRGRPRLTPAERRALAVRVLFTAGEHGIIKAAAIRAQRDLADWARVVLLNAATA